MKFIVQNLYNFSNSVTKNKIHCTQRCQNGNKVINIDCDIPSGTAYSVFNINDTPECFSFSIACNVEGKKSKYIKHLSYATRDKAREAGWDV